MIDEAAVYPQLPQYSLIGKTIKVEVWRKDNNEPSKIFDYQGLSFWRSTTGG